MVLSRHRGRVALASIGRLEMKKSILLACLSVIVCVLALQTPALGDTLSLGTSGNAANWSITGAGATGSPAYQVSTNGAGEISLTSNGLESGTFVSGGSLASFNGFWYADEDFSLPSNASNVTLGFNSLYGNDRTVLELNGIILGDADYDGTTGSGVFSFLPGPPDVSYTFTGTHSGTTASGFIFGGVNDLRLVVNNTGLTPSTTTPTATFQTSGDATDAYLNATLTYTVPEPSTFGLLGVGAISLIAYSWGRKRWTV